MQLLDPWMPIGNAATFENELRKEVPSGHVLEGVKVVALAKRGDCDDVLFRILDGTDRVAVVHLTWSKNVSPEWPLTQFYADVQAWSTTRMASDAKELGDA